MDFLSSLPEILEKVNVLSLLENNCSTGYCIVDLDWTVGWINHAFLEFLGYSQDEVIDRPISLFIQNMEAIAQCLGTLPEHFCDTNAEIKLKNNRVIKINIQILIHGQKFLLLIVPLYSDRAKKIPVTLQAMLQKLTGFKQCLLLEVNAEYPFLIEFVTRECLIILKKDFTEIQQRSLLDFIDEHDQDAIVHTLESLLHIENPQCICSINWMMPNDDTLKLKGIIRYDKDRNFFYFFIAPLRNEKSEMIKILESSKDLSETQLSKIKKLISESLESQGEKEHIQDQRDLFHENQIQVINQRIREIKEQVDITSAQVSAIYPSLTEMIDDYRITKKAQETKSQRIWVFLSNFFNAPVVLIPTTILIVIITLETISFIFPGKKIIIKEIQKDLFELIKQTEPE